MILLNINKNISVHEFNINKVATLKDTLKAVRLLS